MKLQIKKLDAANLQRMLRCDPERIQAEEATPEAIETCRMVGVDLLLAHSEPHMNDATRAIYEEGRKLGVCVVLATSDLSGLKNASAEEAEKILANTRVKIHLQTDAL
ncbi:hypothetical protein JKG47_03025 [Acidithiobacillus sp. MC6.1]|nr:hypothetical protein [Acidithiobacillus sp. MC6.1]